MIATSDFLLTDYWLHKLDKYNTLFVGFSGGLDSTVLLHCLANEPSLIGKLRAVHVHHGLSINANAWQIHCQQVCEVMNVPLIVRQVVIEHQTNIEEQARLARYQVFHSLLATDDGLLLAHHVDDQAETLLLQLLRGAGIDGMAAMLEIKVLTNGELARPFLQHSRQLLEAYAKKHKLVWIDDESNQNTAFSRNFLRHNIMPLLKQKWPGVSTNLARTAMHCQNAKTNLESLAKIDCLKLGDKAQNTLNISSLLALSRARLLNVFRTWLQHNEIRLPSDKILNRLIDELVLTRPDATPKVQWGVVMVRRYQQTLYLLKNEATSCLDWIDWPTFPASLQLSHDQYLYARVAKQGLHVPANQHVQVRFRQGGEEFFWRGQTKQLKKLFQQWQVPLWQRHLIPLLYIDNELAAVVGFAISDRFYRVDGNDSLYQIEAIGGARNG